MVFPSKKLRKENEALRARIELLEKKVLYYEPKKYCRTGDAEPTMTADEALDYFHELERR